MESKPDTGLSVQDVSRRFGPRWAVARATFKVNCGERLMVTGANGSGKTTLLRCLASALKPQHGTIRLRGRNLWEERDQLRRHIAYFSHAPRLYDDLNATDNLNVWARLGRYQIDAPTLLEQVGLPADRTEPVRTFSAGMRRRLAFARVLMQQPQLLLLDEPFSALDPEGRQDLIRLVDGICDSNTILIVASHMPQVCSALCPTGLHMEAGQIVWRGDNASHPLIIGGAI